MIDGDREEIVEGWAMNKMIKVIAWLPMYTAIITTLTLLAIIFGIPFVDES